MSVLSSPIVRLALAGAGLALLWNGLGQVNALLREIPVEQAREVEDVFVATAPPEIFPVWVAPRTASGSVPASGLVDGAFGQRAAEEEGQVEEQAPSYTEALAGAVKVQGTSDSGAFINGRFYRVGASITQLALAGPDGSSLLPKLVSVRSDRIVLSIAQESLVVTKGEPNWP